MTPRHNPRLLGLVCALSAALACGPQRPGETDGGSASDSASDGTNGTTTSATATAGPTTNAPTTGAPTTDSPTTDSPTTGGPQPQPGVPIGVSPQVDVLFVVDNSASMAGPQRKLAQAIGSFVEELDNNGVHWRIGVTTTDSGNPRCAAATTTPESGALVLSSCRDRVAAGEFEVGGEDFSAACTDVCDLTDADLPIAPTPTHVSPGELAPRKWVEARGGASNLPGEVDVIDALQCFLPQGVAGCGFEAHLESMFRALTLAEQPGDNQGFARPGAHLAVIMISDETDCSFTPEFKEIFTTNKVFWEDPDAPAPTSAVCWNAGVTCEGPGPLFPSCAADNHDLTGAGGASDDGAVLQPLSKYAQLLQSLEQAKQAVDPQLEVKVSLIAGVPFGYETHDADITFADAEDPALQDSFGIGPGCEGGGVVAVPPVREREIGEATATNDVREVFSICDDDYDAALRTIAQLIRTQLQPACMPLCVADTDPNTPIVEPQCQLFEIDLADQSSVEIAPCVLAGETVEVPPGATACFVALTDQNQLTPSQLDDMSVECTETGHNLQFVIVRSGGPPLFSGFEAVCELSANPAVDCPGL